MFWILKGMKFSSIEMFLAHRQFLALSQSLKNKFQMILLIKKLCIPLAMCSRLDIIRSIEHSNRLAFGQAMAVWKWPNVNRFCSSMLMETWAFQELSNGAHKTSASKMCFFFLFEDFWAVLHIYIAWICHWF